MWITDRVPCRPDPGYVDLSRRRRIRNSEVSAKGDCRTVTRAGITHSRDGIVGKLGEVQVGSLADAKRIRTGYDRLIAGYEIVIGGAERVGTLTPSLYSPPALDSLVERVRQRPPKVPPTRLVSLRNRAQSSRVRCHRLDPAGDGYDHLPDILSGSGISGHGSERQVVQQLRCGHHLVSGTESLADRDHRRWGDIERRVLEPGRDGRLHRIDVYDVRADSTNHAGSSARDDLHHCRHLSPGTLFPAKGRNNS